MNMKHLAYVGLLTDWLLDAPEGTGGYSAYVKSIMYKEVLKAHKELSVAKTSFWTCITNTCFGKRSGEVKPKVNWAIDRSPERALFKAFDAIVNTYHHPINPEKLHLRLHSKAIVMHWLSVFDKRSISNSTN
jgi:hypothetical protein